MFVLIMKFWIIINHFQSRWFDNFPSLFCSGLKLTLGHYLLQWNPSLYLLLVWKDWQNSHIWLTLISWVIWWIIWKYLLLEVAIQATLLTSVPNVWLYRNDSNAALLPLKWWGTILMPWMLIYRTSLSIFTILFLNTGQEGLF